MDVAELSMFLDTLGMGKGTHTESEFETAANAVKNMKDLDDAQRLQLYGLYKQGTVGDADGSEPSELDMVAAAKWSAWKGFAGMPKQNAVLSYVYIVSTLIDPNREASTNLLLCSYADREVTIDDILHFFIQFGPGSVMEGMGNIVSTLNSGEASEWSDAYAIFKAIEMEDINELRKCLHLESINNEPTVNNIETEEKNVLLTEDEGRNVLLNILSLKSPGGLTPLLYSADRGVVEIVELLLSCNADINATEDDGNTALMLAVICEHTEIVELLLSKGADIGIKNSSGECVLSMEGVSDEIKLLLSKVSITP